MTIIEISFEQNGKPYSYLLVNPKKYEFNKNKPLLQAKGVNSRGIINRYLYVSNIYKAEELPSVVTSQIVLLDGNNHVDVQKIGSVATTFEEEREETEALSKTDTDASNEARQFVLKAQALAKATNSYMRSFNRARRR